MMTKITTTTTTFSFWALGLLNNTGYCIMLASAKHMSEGGTALVFVVNVIPALLVKLSTPYWFHYVSYPLRMWMTTFLMLGGYLIVGIGSLMPHNRALPFQLVGVAFASAQCGLGEATLLALAGKLDQEENNHQVGIIQQNHPKRHDHRHGRQSSLLRQQQQQQDSQSDLSPNVCLNSFASGTGFSGVFGFLWKVVLIDILQISLATMQFLACSLALLYGGIYQRNLSHSSSSTKFRPPPSSLVMNEEVRTTANASSFVDETRPLSMNQTETSSLLLSHHRHLETKDDQLSRSNKRKRISLVGGHDSIGYYSSVLEGKNEEETRLHASQEHHPIDNNVPTTTQRVSDILINLNDDDDFDNNNDDDDDEFGDNDKLMVNALLDHHDDTTAKDWSLRQRCVAILQLYPYMVPLFTVYVAEYLLQAGAWTAIGLLHSPPPPPKNPIAANVQARRRFYTYSNWLYQMGVLVSRSSGSLFDCPLWFLWTMPLLQMINVIFFSWIAAVVQPIIMTDENDDDALMQSSSMFLQWIFSPYILYPICFYVGLLGGGVYIHGYVRICRDIPQQHCEFALSTTSMSEAWGVLVADIMSLYLQSCLYQINGFYSTSSITDPRGAGGGGGGGGEASSASTVSPVVQCPSTWTKL